MPAGIAQRAASFELSVYDASVSCASLETMAATPAQRKRLAEPSLTVEVADGRWTLEVSAFDSAGNAIGRGCTAIRVSDSVAFCVSLSLDSLDGGLDGGADLAGDGGSCGPRDNGAGGTYLSCNPPGTHSRDDAQAACNSRFPDSECQRESCSNGAEAVCPKDGTCQCWQFSGPATTSCSGCQVVASWQ